ncbi:hypothetical protein M758_4G149400 [Ceratodon purpureus]|nr:hypothetical protein M758_4G149400 [Ceratodon purpureus]
MDSDVESLLEMSPEDQKVNTDTYEDPLTSLEDHGSNTKGHDQEAHTKLNNCEKCKQLEDCLQNTLDENAAMKNLLKNVYERYNEMKEAKFILEENVKALKPFRIRKRKEIAPPKMYSRVRG